MRIIRWSAGSIVVLALGSASAGAGVRPLTEQSAKDAVKRGQAMKKIGDLCPRFVVEKKGMMSIRGRFEIYIDTPFCVVASNAFEAKRKYETPPEAVILPGAEQVVLVRVNPTTVAGGFMGSTAPFSMTSEGPNILTNVHKVLDSGRFSLRLGHPVRARAGQRSRSTCRRMNSSSSESPQPPGRNSGRVFRSA